MADLLKYQVVSVSRVYQAEIAQDDLVIQLLLSDGSNQTLVEHLPTSDFDITDASSIKAYIDTLHTGGFIV